MMKGLKGSADETFEVGAYVKCRGKEWSRDDSWMVGQVTVAGSAAGCKIIRLGWAKA